MFSNTVKMFCLASMMLAVVAAAAELNEWNATEVKSEDGYVVDLGVDFWYTVGGIICIVLLLVVLILYATVSNYRTVYGFKICCLMLGYISIYLSLVLTNLRVDFFPCHAQGYAFGYSIIFCVFWLSLMCFDCFALYRSNGATWDEKNRLPCSLMYGFGGPILLLLLSVILEKTDAVDNRFRPLFSTWMCFFEDNRTADFLHFFLPLLLLISAGTTFLVIASYRAHHFQTLPKNAGHVERTRCDNERLKFTAKLFTVTSIAVMLNFLAWLAADQVWLYLVSSMYGYGQAILVFFICVTNAEMKNWLKDRVCLV